MKHYLLLLLAFLFPGATDPEVDPPEDAGTDDSTVDDATVDDADDSDDVDIEAADDADPDETPAPRPARTRPEPRNEAAEAVRIAREAADAVQALRSPPAVDPTWAEEESRLKDPNITPLDKWQIESTRAIRFSNQSARQAVFQAADLADKAEYLNKSAENAVYARYKDKVEAKLAEIRKTTNGQANPPRAFVLAQVVGQAMIDGNFKPVKAATKRVDIPRGKSPGVRSDTPGRGARTEHQKRIERLRNTII